MPGPLLTTATLSKPPEGTPLPENTSVLHNVQPTRSTALSPVSAPSISAAKKSFFVRLNDWLTLHLTKISLTDRTVFTQNLHVMVKSSMSLTQSLGTLAEQMKNKRFKQILLTMKQRVEKGETFATALAQYTSVFSEVYVSMVAAGEASGKLETILAQLTKQLKKQRELTGKIKGALTYPVIVVIAMVGIGTAMIIFVIPKITAIYKEANIKLPLPTQILISISDFVIHNSILTAIAFVALVLGFARFRKMKFGKRFLHRLYLRTPILSTIIKKINLARFSRTLHSLLQTDIPIVQSFQIIERTLGNVFYREAVENAAQELKRGVTVADALKKSPQLFPPLVTQMLAVGEESGTLDELADEIANFYEEDVDETMANFSSIIEPVLMLVLGVGVGGMAIAVMLPMYTLTQAI